MEADGTVRKRIDELLDERLLGTAQLLGRALGRHAARIDHVDVVGDLERFDDVVGHDDRRGVQRIVELADQVGGDAERNRIKGPRTARRT